MIYFLESIFSLQDPTIEAQIVHTEYHMVQAYYEHIEGRS